MTYISVKKLLKKERPEHRQHQKFRIACREPPSSCTACKN